MLTKALPPLFYYNACMQFLDCVWQVMRQYPHYFEFNSRFILTIADHIYSGRFSTFLFSCDQDREKHNARRCVDIWSYLQFNRELFVTDIYMDPSTSKVRIKVYIYIYII